MNLKNTRSIYESPYGVGNLDVGLNASKAVFKSYLCSNVILFWANWFVLSSYWLSICIYSRTKQAARKLKILFGLASRLMSLMEILPRSSALMWVAFVCNIDLGCLPVEKLRWVLLYILTIFWEWKGCWINHNQI